LTIKKFVGPEEGREYMLFVGFFGIWFVWNIWNLFAIFCLKFSGFFFVVQNILCQSKFSGFWSHDFILLKIFTFFDGKILYYSNFSFLTTKN
jgi:hypothetical protein